MPEERSGSDLGPSFGRPSLAVHAISYATAVSASVLAMLTQGLRAPWAWVLIGTPFLLLLAVYSSRWIRRRWQIEPSALMFPARPARGVVAFVSLGPGSETAARAVEFHGASLHHAWLFYSDASRDAALEIVESLSATRHLRREIFHLIALSDTEFGNPGSVNDRIDREVFQALPEGLGPQDVVVDITGGLKGTTAGAFLAGIPRGRRLQYVPPATLDDRGRGKSPHTPLEIEIDYKIKRLRSR